VRSKKAVGKNYRPWEVKQDFLLPPSLLEWLPEGHLARFVLEVVEELELGPIYETYERESTVRAEDDGDAVAVCVRDRGDVIAAD